MPSGQNRSPGAGAQDQRITHSFGVKEGNPRIGIGEVNRHLVPPQPLYAHLPPAADRRHTGRTQDQRLAQLRQIHARAALAGNAQRVVAD